MVGLVTFFPNFQVGTEVFSLTFTRKHALLNVCSCGGWDGFGQQFDEDMGELSLDNVIREMLWSASRWSRVTHYGRVPFVARRIQEITKPSV